MNKKQRDFRCNGHNKSGRQCNQLLFRYYIDGDEITIAVKCPSCNSFSILRLSFVKENESIKLKEK
jgi:phage FluMu protein Com